MVNSVWRDDIVERAIIAPAASVKRCSAAMLCSFDIDFSWALYPLWDTSPRFCLPFQYRHRYKKDQTPSCLCAMLESERQEAPRQRDDLKPLC